MEKYFGNEVQSYQNNKEFIFTIIHDLYWNMCVLYIQSCVKIPQSTIRKKKKVEKPHTRTFNSNESIKKKTISCFLFNLKKHFLFKRRWKQQQQLEIVYFVRSEMILLKKIINVFTWSLLWPIFSTIFHNLVNMYVLL